MRSVGCQYDPRFADFDIGSFSEQRMQNNTASVGIQSYPMMQRDCSYVLPNYDENISPKFLSSHIPQIRRFNSVEQRMPFYPQFLHDNQNLAEYGDMSAQCSEGNGLLQNNYSMELPEDVDPWLYEQEFYNQLEEAQGTSYTKDGNIDFIRMQARARIDDSLKKAGANTGGVARLFQHNNKRALSGGDANAVPQFHQVQYQNKLENPTASYEQIPYEQFGESQVLFPETNKSTSGTFFRKQSLARVNDSLKRKSLNASNFFKAHAQGVKKFVLAVENSNFAARSRYIGNKGKRKLVDFAKKTFVNVSNKLLDAHIAIQQKKIEHSLGEDAGLSVLCSAERKKWYNEVNKNGGTVREEVLDDFLANDIIDDEVEVCAPIYHVGKLFQDISIDEEPTIAGSVIQSAAIAFSKVLEGVETEQVPKNLQGLLTPYEDLEHSYNRLYTTLVHGASEKTSGRLGKLVAKVQTLGRVQHIENLNLAYGSIRISRYKNAERARKTVADILQRAEGTREHYIMVDFLRPVGNDGEVRDAEKILSEQICELNNRKNYRPVSCSFEVDGIVNTIFFDDTTEQWWMIDPDVGATALGHSLQKAVEELEDMLENEEPLRLSNVVMEKNTALALEKKKNFRESVRIFGDKMYMKNKDDSTIVCEFAVDPNTHEEYIKKKVHYRDDEEFLVCEYDSASRLIAVKQKESLGSEDGVRLCFDPYTGKQVSTEDIMWYDEYEESLYDKIAIAGENALGAMKQDFESTESESSSSSSYSSESSSYSSSSSFSSSYSDTSSSDSSTSSSSSSYSSESSSYSSSSSSSSSYSDTSSSDSSTSSSYSSESSSYSSR